jgi:hypothetical protein
MDLGPFVDPDESYLIFESARPGGYGFSDLYISFKRSDGSWTPALNMGEPINSSARETAASVSPDGLYLFFLSDRHQQWDSNPYWVSAQVIEDLRQVADVSESSIQTPQDFRLNQNYPNPFNSGTTISFEMRQPSFVTLKIYDLLGNEAKNVLTRVHFKQGYHTIHVNTQSMASGIYYYRLALGNSESQVRKMCLAR